MKAEYIRMTRQSRAYIKRAAEIYNHYILHSTATFSTEEVTPDEMEKILYLGISPYECYAVLQQGEMVGYVCFECYRARRAYDRTAELTIYLDPSHRGGGIGGEAVAFIEERAKNAGMLCLIAVICGENERSCRLFAGCGYDKCGHIRDAGVKFGRRLDVVFYQKITDPGKQRD